MTTRGRGNGGIAVSRSSLKWLAVLAIPFSVFFIEARLNTAILKRDIELGAINAELKKLQETFDAYNIRIVTLETQGRIEMQAPDLGLVPPQPNQIKTIYYVEGDPAGSPSDFFETAGGAAQPAPPAHSEESSWSSNSHSSLREQTGPTARLRGAILAGCGSFSGSS